MAFIELLPLLLIVSFLLDGSRCLFSDAMVHEFQRWGVPRLRYVTGLLEVLGSLGIFIGQWFPWIAVLSAAGLALLMVCGLCIRIRVKDTLVETLPAIFFLAVSVLETYRVGIAL